MFILLRIEKLAKPRCLISAVTLASSHVLRTRLHAVLAFFTFWREYSPHDDAHERSGAPRPTTYSPLVVKALA